MQKSIISSLRGRALYEWEQPIWPPPIVMRGYRHTTEIFGFTFDMQMRYLVYMRYLWSCHVVSVRIILLSLRE